MAEIAFWAALGAVVYAYVGYGALMRVLARVRPRPVTSGGIRPFVSVVVTAYNEEDTVVQRIENLLAADYPRDRLEIIVASDGSTDRTVARAGGISPDVRVVAFPGRRGKPAMLNDVVPSARGDIVVLADARQRFERGAIAALVASFADPSVGAVSGELILLKEGETDPAVDGTALYWDFEKQIRFAESRVDSTVGATGAIYAIRRELFTPIPPNTILDDVVVPMSIARRGYRVLFEPAALAFDRRAASARQEFGRKVRTIAGNFQMLAAERWLLSPRQNRLWWQTFSHKILRLLLPVCYAVALVANLMLLDQPFYRWTLAGGVLFVVAAVAGLAVPAARRVLPVLSVPYGICFLTWATVIGFLRFLTGRQQVTWERVPQAPAAGPGQGA
jgi:cellulose synthase/poly-beta-1,6-N-acetylglucosamine synthase-like glycosyltransferase